MRNLELNTMENLQGGDVSPGAAFACGFGLATAVLGFAVIGPVALLGVSACLLSDERTNEN
ncbi:hypothetical protein [uncultured Aquimarina sp.]|uniref:hypothetical protein n=1 Tax=uncultured Aquimarina sp. TaxID=575652 RepID=UPI002602E377|nr:hypothetical protein [uncultured Aquimarina sp.]